MAKDEGLLLPPRCHGFSVFRADVAESCSIIWDETHHRYYVKFFSRIELDALNALITSVAAKSQCSCGKPLLLSDYSVSTIRKRDKTLREFEGIYRCSQCTTAKPSALESLGNLFKKLADFDSIEVSTKGVSYKRGKAKQ